MKTPSDRITEIERNTNTLTIKALSLKLELSKADFKEEDHPRADDGKFGEGSGRSEEKENVNGGSSKESEKISDEKLKPKSSDDSNLKPEEYPTKGEVSEYLKRRFPENRTLQFQAKLLSRNPDEKITDKHLPDLVAASFSDDDIKAVGYQGSYASGKESNQLKRDLIAHIKATKKNGG